MNLAPKVEDRFPIFEAPLRPSNLTASRCSTPDAPSKNILIVRTIAHGDILMSTPLIASIRSEMPGAHITYLVDRREREAIEVNPHIDRILLWDTEYWKSMTRRGNYLAWYARVRRLRQMLHSARFDTLISLMPEDWGWLVSAAGAKQNIGVFDTFREYHRQTKTSRRSRLYQSAFTYEELPAHRTDQYLLPLRAMGLTAQSDRRMFLGYTETDEDAASAFIEANDLGDRFVVVAPVAGWESRRWPADRWAEFCAAVAHEHDCRVVLVGGAGDRDVIAEIAVNVPGRRPAMAAGAFGFRMLAALSARALLVVSGDTGPMHVAAAVGTPYLALFGPTPASRFAPLAGKGLPLFHPVTCGPCHQRECMKRGDDHLRCLRLISVSEALESAAALLGRRIATSRRGRVGDSSQFADEEASQHPSGRKLFRRMGRHRATHVESLREARAARPQSHGNLPPRSVR